MSPITPDASCPVDTLKKKKLPRFHVTVEGSFENVIQTWTTASRCTLFIFLENEKSKQNKELR